MTVIKKTESTSQTYGQMVVFPSNKEGQTTTPLTNASLSVKQQSSVSISDTAVKVVQPIGALPSDTDKSKIAVAAANNSSAVIAVGNEKLSSVAAQVANAQPTIAIVLGSLLKSKEDVKKSLTEAQKVDLSISLRSKDSESIQMNILKTPEIEGEFIYNFFESDEESVELQEDQARDPLLKNDINHVPKYVLLRWNASKITEQLTQDEKELSKPTKIVQESLWKKRGVVSNKGSNFKDAFSKSAKKTNLVENDGIKSEIVDIHKLDEAFDATVNKKVFSNAVSAVFNIIEKQNVVDALPLSVLEQSKK